MKPKKSILGKQVKTLLAQKNLSQRQFAETLKLSPSTLNNYLTDKREPDFDTLINIATILDTSIDFLLDYTPPHMKVEKTPLQAKFESELLPLTQDMSVGQLELILKHAKILSSYICEKRVLPVTPSASNNTSVSINTITSNTTTVTTPISTNKSEEN